MRIFKAALVLLTLLISSVFVTKAQGLKIAVNEYYERPQGNNPYGEFIELVVLEDDVDIRGWIVRDNSSIQQWSGGVKFKNVPLWQHLRKGTIIVLRTRTNYAYLSNVNEGVIDLGSETTLYLDQYVATVGYDWNQTWIINHATDIVQILDASGTPHHTMGHSNGDAAYLTYAVGAAAPGKKMILKTNYGSSAISVASVASSQAGYDDFNNVNITYASSQGKANLEKPSNGGGFGAHSQYLRSIRQPEWVSPNVSAVPVKGGIQLTWATHATDPVPADSSTGYLVLRCEKNSKADFTPIDGVIYSKGATVGGVWTVVDNIENSQINTYLDPIENCDVYYSYKVFTFRFRQSSGGSFGDDTPPDNARGRSYNETSFAECDGFRPSPAKPTIFVEGGKSVLCVGDIVKLVAKDLPKGNNYSYTWRKSGAVTTEQHLDTITVDTEGKQALQYQLQVVNEFGCKSESNTIDLNVLPTPEIVLSSKKGTAANFTIVNNNQTISLCSGEILKLRAFVNIDGSIDPNVPRQWYKDGIAINTNLPEIDASANGTYTFVATNGGACSDTSFKVIVINQNINLSFDQTTGTLILGSSDSDITKDFVLTNNSNDPISIPKDSLVIDAGFTIESPTVFPIVIPAKGKVTIKIKFSYPSPGPVTMTGALTVKSPCSVKTIVNLTGLKSDASSKIVATPKTLTFKIPICEASKKDTIITLTGFGSESKTIYPIVVQGANFTVNSTGMKTSLGLNESTQFTVTLSSAVAINKCIIKVPYKVESPGNTKIDTEYVNFDVEVVTPKANLSANVLDFGTFKDCQTSADSSFTITNPTNLDLLINEQPTDNRISFESLPLTIPANNSLTVKLHYTPTNVVEDFDYNIKLQPCDLIVSQKVKSTLKGSVIYKFEKDTVDFGTIADCSNPNTVYNTINLAVNGGSGKVRSIKSISSDFETDLAAGMVLNANNNVKFGLKTSGNKTYSGQIEIVFEPCGEVKTVYFKGVRTAPDYELQDLLAGQTLEFGETLPDEVRTKKFKFKNNGNAPIVIQSLKNIAGPFTLISPTLPVSVTKDQTIEFTIQYKQSVNSNDTLNVDLTTSLPCDIAKRLVFTGSAKSPMTAVSLILSAPLKITVEQGKTFDLPYTFTQSGSSKIDEAGVTSFVIYVSYREDLAVPLLAYPGSEMLKSIGSVGVSEFDYKSGYAKAKFTGDVILSKGLQDGIWAKVRFKGLLGATTKTKITVDSVVFNSTVKVTAEPCETELTVTGSCDFANRTMQVSGAPMINTKTSVVNSGDVEVNFTTAVDGYACAKVMDAYGASVNILSDGDLQSGSYTVNLKTDNLANGVYYLTLYTGGQVYSSKILINK